MADNSEGTGNLEVQKSINEAIAARSALLIKQTELMKGQAQIASEICKSLNCEGLESLTNKTQEFSASLGAAQKEADKLKGGMTAATQESSKGLKSVSKGAFKVSTAIKVASSAATAFGDAAGAAFSKAAAQLDSLTQFVGSVGRGIFSIAQSLIAIPLGIFNKFLDMASDLAKEIDPVRQAMEDVRETFGNLNRAEAAQTIDSFNNLRNSANGLAGSGLALSKVYGYGREGLAAALKDVLATAEAMGPVFGALGDQFTDNASSLIVMQKGLGLTGDEMKAFGSFALMSGQNVNDVLLKTANLSLQMGAKFGISSKLIGKDLGYMTANIGKFGSMTKTQMATATVYVRKLGLEIKDVEGLIGVFDDFEGAATAASKLAQAFGMNVDAMQMMQEQDPAKRLDSLRQAFAATGKSIESMSRQEKALLAQTAGLDENTVSLALSTENMGMSYEEIQKAAEESGDHQLSQAEIMQQTSENIKRLIEELSQTTGSFLDTFINGFMKGISQTKEFRAMMHTLARVLKETYWFGVKVGEIFVDAFPGVKEMFNSITEFFGSMKIGASTDSIRKFFSSFSTAAGAKESLQNLFGFFDAKSGGMMKFFDPKGPFMMGVNNFGTAILNGINEAIPVLTDYISSKLDELTEWVNTWMVEDLFDVDPKRTLTPLEKLFSNLFDSLYNKLLPKLWGLFSKMFSKLWESPTMKKVLVGLLVGAAAFIFGPAALAGLGTFLTTVVGAIGTLFTGLLTSAAVLEGIAAAGTSILAALGAALSNPVGWALLAAGIIALIPLLFAAFGTLIGGVFKLMGKDTFIKSLGVDPTSWLGKTAASFYEVTVGMFDLLFKGFEDLFTGLWGAVDALMKGDVDEFKKSMGLALWGLGEALWAGFNMIGVGIIAAVTSFGVGFVKAVEMTIPMIKVVGLTLLDALTWPFRNFLELIGVSIPSPSKMFEAIVGPVSEFYNRVSEYLGFGGAVTEQIAEAIKSSGEEIQKASEDSGKKAGSGWSDGIMSGFKAAPKTAEQQLADVTSLVGDYSSKSTKEIALKAEEINKGLDNLKQIVSKIDKSKMTEIESAVKGLNVSAMSTASDAISTIDYAISSVVEPISNMGGNLIKLSEMSKNFDSADVSGGISSLMNSFLAPLSIVSTWSTILGSYAASLTQFRDVELSSTVQAIVEDIRATNDALAELGNVDISATVGKVGAALGLKDEILKVESKPIQMNVKINLTMRADDIAKEIMDVTAKTLKDKDKASDGMKELFPGYA